MTRIGELLSPEQAARLNGAMHAVIFGYRRPLSDDRRRLLAGNNYIDLAGKVVGVGSVATRTVARQPPVVDLLDRYAEILGELVDADELF